MTKLRRVARGRFWLVWGLLALPLVLASCQSTQELGDTTCDVGQFCVYQSANYQQAMSAYGTEPYDFKNYVYATDNGRVMNDDISSAKNKHESCGHRLYENNDYSGHLRYVSPKYSVSDLSGSELGNDEASSSLWWC